MISRLDWQQANPTEIQYTFQLKSRQQWGYKLRYEGTSLILALRHPPDLGTQVKFRPRVGWGNNDPFDPFWNNWAGGLEVIPVKSLKGMTILLDPGHGSSNDLGARGPTGYPEKDATLILAKLLRTELEQRGATVLLTREGDEDLYPQDRATQINRLQPTLALSLHYNALPDDGDAMHTQGVSTFWYNPQAQSLAMFLHNYLVMKLHRPSYGVFWNNLALTRPTVAPAVLLELGFMINPEEFEWIVNPKAQRQLARAIAEGIMHWVRLSL